MPRTKASREEIARLEVGVTKISRSGARILSFGFLLAIFLVPLAQLVIDSISGKRHVFPHLEPSATTTLRAKVVSVNTQLLKGFNQLESDLEDESFLRSIFLPPLQYGFTKFLKQGNEKVVIGEDGYLFYRPAVDHLIGPPFLDKHQLNIRSESHELWEKPVQPNPVQAIVSFHADLAARSIELVVLPVPVKAAVTPSTLSLQAVEQPLSNSSWKRFIAHLERAGIAVVDIRSLLHNLETRTGNAYLKTDTHWSPEAMDLVAEKVADFLMKRDPEMRGNAGYKLHRNEFAGSGDLVRMLVL